MSTCTNASGDVNNALHSAVGGKADEAITLTLAYGAYMN
jgi:hypothetical protein